MLVERPGPYRPQRWLASGSRHPRVPREVPWALGEAKISARTPALPAPTATAKRGRGRGLADPFGRIAQSHASASLSFPRSPRARP